MNAFTARFVISLMSAMLIATACGSGTTTPEAAAPVETTTPADTPALRDSPGVRLISAADGAAIAENPPEDLVILDVRTLEEFTEGHIEGATMLDFYESDFGERLAQLDKDVPYLLYCRSGNRSGQTAAMMQQLGFSDVADVDGGIVSWLSTGLPTVTE